MLVELFSLHPNFKSDVPKFSRNWLKITSSKCFPKRVISDKWYTTKFSLSDISQFLYLGIGITVLVTKSLGTETWEIIAVNKNEIWIDISKPAFTKWSDDNIKPPSVLCNLCFSMASFTSHALKVHSREIFLFYISNHWPKWILFQIGMLFQKLRFNPKCWLW